MPALLFLAGAVLSGHNTALVRLDVYGVGVACVPNGGPLAVSPAISNSDWTPTCLVFTPPLDTQGIMLVATSDTNTDAERAPLLDNLRADPSCAS